MVISLQDMLNGSFPSIARVSCHSTVNYLVISINRKLASKTTAAERQSDAQPCLFVSPENDIRVNTFDLIWERVDLSNRFVWTIDGQWTCVNNSHLVALHRIFFLTACMCAGNLQLFRSRSRLHVCPTVLFFNSIRRLPPCRF